MGDGSSRAIGLTARPDPTLTTPRLLLRRWRQADLEPFASLNADPDVMRFFSHPLSRAESDAFAERIETQFDVRGYGLWAVERKGDGAFLGFTGLAYQEFDAAFTPCVEVGWRFARAAWGHGYATEAGRGRSAAAVRAVPPNPDPVASAAATLRDWPHRRTAPGPIR